MLLKLIKYEFICIKKKKKKKRLYDTQNKTCPSDVNVSLNSETKLCNRLLVDLLYFWHYTML
jgi:hypothetical protein